MAAGMRELQSYVTEADADAYGSVSDGMVVVDVSHSNLVNHNMMGIRLELHATIEQTKVKLYRHCGTPPEHQILVLKNCGEPIAEMSDDSKMLGFYGVTHGMEIKVIDTDPHSLSRNGGLEDVSQVKKYRMSEEDYDKRAGTLRDWKRKELAKDPGFRDKHPELFPQVRSTFTGPPPGAKECEGTEVGMRCQVNPGGRLGTVKYVGEIPELEPGHWIGVVLDEPLGRNAGLAKGVAYMECGPNFGVFARPWGVQCGDFPEEEMFDTESDSEEEL